MSRRSHNISGDINFCCSVIPFNPVLSFPVMGYLIVAVCVLKSLVEEKTVTNCAKPPCLLDELCAHRWVSCAANYCTLLFVLGQEGNCNKDLVWLKDA